MPEQRGQLKGGQRSVVIVGSGPSVLSGLGPVIDSMTVVRLKQGLTDPVHRGVRTDYLCARSSRYDMGKHPFWLLKDAYPEYTGKKPTTGLCAVLEVIERLKPDRIYVSGFDRLMHPDRPDPPNTWLAHDKWAEHKLLMTLGVRELV
jgi:hypothetical protein